MTVNIPTTRTDTSTKTVSFDRELFWLNAIVASFSGSIDAQWLARKIVNHLVGFRALVTKPAHRTKKTGKTRKTKHNAGKAYMAVDFSPCKRIE